MLSAAFDAQYAPIERSTRRALTLDVATIDPGLPASIIARASAAHHEQRPPGVDRDHAVRLVHRQVEEHAGMADPGGDGDLGRHADTVSTSPRAPASSTDAGSVTSHFTSYVPAISHTTTSAPKRALGSATAAPMPEAPPTTTSVTAASSAAQLRSL